MITSSKRIRQRGKSKHICARTDLSINSDDLESLCIELHHKKDKNILFSVMYRPSNGDLTVFEELCEKLLSVKHYICWSFEY